MLICQLTDLHVRPRGVAATRVVETNMLTERAFRAVAAFTPKPDVVLITGDLTDCGLPDEYRNLTGMLERTLSMPVYVIPGNHDRRGNFRAGLAHLPYVTSHPEFVQYAVEDHEIRLVMLDTVVPGAGHGELSPEQLEWLDQTLSAQPNKPTLIGMHHPPLVTGIPHMDKIALRNPGTFRSVISRHPQVKRIVCGHVHRPIVGHCSHAIVTVSPSVAHQVELTFDPRDPGASIFEPPAFQLHLCQGTEDFISHTVYTENHPGPFRSGLDPDYPGI